MTHAHRAGRREAARHRAQRRRLLQFGGAVLGVALVALVVILASRGGDGDRPSDGSQLTNDAAATWSTASYSGGPRLAVDRTAIDAGNVAYEQPVQATYRVKNVGDAPLTLGTPTVSILEGC
jgi:hypothetical protein